MLNCCPSMCYSLFPNEVLDIDIHDCKCEHMSYNNNVGWAIIHRGKSNCNSPKCVGVARFLSQQQNRMQRQIMVSNIIQKYSLSHPKLRGMTLCIKLRYNKEEATPFTNIGEWEKTHKYGIWMQKFVSCLSSTPFTLTIKDLPLFHHSCHHLIQCREGHPMPSTWTIV